MKYVHLIPMFIINLYTLKRLQYYDCLKNNKYWINRTKHSKQIILLFVQDVLSSVFTWIDRSESKT